MRILTLLFVFVSSALFCQEDWLTHYERSGKTKTPRYEETLDFCRRLDEASGKVSLVSFGKSAQGRDLPLMIIDRDGLSDPKEIREQGRIILLVQACIHPGEAEGKDAGLLLIRDMIIHHEQELLLDHVSLIFIPIFNVDGHERFGPFNRINQNGPEEMGWRVTANNLNLNRDFLKAETPEMRAWLFLFNTWMPDFFIDTHTTDGADYQYPLTYLLEIFGNMDQGLTDWTREVFIPEMTGAMDQRGFPVFPYVDFRRWHDPRSGLVSEVAPPMLSQGYTSLRNRPGLLIETHMLKPYPVRVEATYQCILSSLEILAKNKKEVQDLIRNADESVCSPTFREKPFPLQFQVLENDSIMVPFRGFDYSLEKSTVSGGSWFKYSNTPSTFLLPYFSINVPTVDAHLPYAYIIPAEWTLVIEKLRIHDVEMKFLKTQEMIHVSTWRFSNPKWQQNPYEGRHPLVQFDLEEITEERSFRPGSAIVEVSQKSARIIAHLLEPKGNGSLLYWGYLDAIFEQKEYAENYVLEKMALEMLRDPAIKKEYEHKMRSDSVFAKNPQQILFWFYAKSPYVDQRRMIYPIGKITSKEVLKRLTDQ